ncbi:MAG: alpha/beta hydrolase [Bacteroidia bacterium]
MKRIIIAFLVFTSIGTYSYASVFAVSVADTPLVYIKCEPKIKIAKPPVLILMHGLGSNEKDLFGLAAQVPDSFLVISLRAPYSYTQDGYAWYSVKFKGNQNIGNIPEMQKSKEKIITFISDLETKKVIDPKKIYLGGFSQGAIMSYEIALCKPEKVKGIIVLGGRLPDGLESRVAKKEQIKNLKIFIAHGREDKRIDFKKAEEANEYLKKLGLTSKFNKYPIGHSISDQMWMDAMNWLRK